MPGNVFSNSLYSLGQWLLNNPQGTGQQAPSGATPAGTQTPQKINTTWTYGSPPSPAAIPTNVQPPPPEQTTTAQAAAVPNQPTQFQQPNLPGAEAVPYKNQAPSSLGGGGGGGESLAGLAGSGAAGAMQGKQAGGPGGVAGGVQGALGGISKALEQAGTAIGNVNTMPQIIQGGQIPSLNQQAPTLIGRRPQTAFYG